MLSSFIIFYFSTQISTLEENNFLSKRPLSRAAEIFSIGDLVFEKYIEHEVILKSIMELAEKINEDFEDKNPLFLAVLNGSFVFAGELLQHIDVFCEVSFIKVASYQYSQSTGQILKLIGATAEMTGREVVILEDIIDTGKTLEYLVEEVRKAGASNLKVVSLFLKPNSYKGKAKIDYVGLEIEDHFVVGYGMDYNQKGRNLKDLYKLRESKD